MIKSLAVAIFLMLVQSAVASAAELRIATAANFYHTLNKLRMDYEKKHQEKIEIIRGSTGKLYAQIIHGAPFDMFFSADTRRPDKLIESGKALAKESAIYATGQLALWKPDMDSSQQLLEKLNSGEFKKLAIANPKTAPYGQAAVETLKALELYDAVKHKLVYAENIAQAVQYVQSGAADLGLVARSYVNHDVFYEVDPYLHQPIEQKVVVLKQARNHQSALRFLRYLQTDSAKQILTEDGYIN